MKVGNFFINLGKALMLPIAVLPIAGILLRIGQPDLLNVAFISAAGNAVFSNLPIIFALGVAIGFAEDNHGSAGLAAFIGHSIFMAALLVLLPGANMGVFSGIIIGALAGGLYNKYKNISLPVYIAFFGGRRFIPIVTGLISLLFAFIFSIIWPPIDLLVKGLGDFIIHSDNIGLFIYGVANRLLIPLGLHHILNSLVWFTFGDYSVVENGVTVIKHGDLWRFFAGDKTAGSFMAGFFPIMMFGLPAAAMAMIVTAKKEKRGMMMGILGSAALTAFLTGVTEPLEFSFMFLAFPLYVVHAILTGISLVVMNIFDVKLGFTFSAGLFDYLISGKLGTNPLLLFPIGLIFAVVYFVIFYFAIKIWNIKTPGREDESSNVLDTTTVANKLASNEPIKNVADKDNEEALLYLSAMGGSENIVHIGHCTTRLRVSIVDNSKIDVETLKKLGAKGVINNIEGNVQIIIGMQVEALADKIKKVFQSK